MRLESGRKSHASSSNRQAPRAPSRLRLHFSPGPQGPGAYGSQARTQRPPRQKEPSGQGGPSFEQPDTHRIHTFPGFSSRERVSQVCPSGQGARWQLIPWTVAQTETPSRKRMHS